MVFVVFTAYFDKFESIAKLIVRAGWEAIDDN